MYKFTNVHMYKCRKAKMLESRKGNEGNQGNQNKPGQSKPLRAILTNWGNLKQAGQYKPIGVI